MLHTLLKVRGKQGYFVIKVNLAKAYDMLRWSFIEDIMKEVGFP